MDQSLRGEAQRTRQRLIELETTVRRARHMVDRILDELDAVMQTELFPEDRDATPV